MDTIELSYSVLPNTTENLEIIAAMLSSKGFETFMETETGYNAYIPSGSFKVDDMVEMAEKTEFCKFLFRFQLIKDQDWNTEWEQNYFKPIVISDQCVIRASFHKDYPKTKHEIIINPKTAFGTGNHATTFLIIEQIIKLEMQEKTVLDLGCGTAILAILSKKLGSGNILAIDNNEKAITNSHQNIKANNTSGITLLLGTALSLENQTFDVIFENIWKNIVKADMPITYKALKKGGTIIFSGFYEADVPEVRAAAEKQGFLYQSHTVKDDWAAVVFIKN